MKNILVFGATGQIGSELTLELRKRYGDDHVVAGYIPSAMPKGELKASGPSAIADVTDRQSIEVVARQFKIDTIYSEFHRFVRRSYASCEDTAGHYPASAYHVWGDKSDD